MGLAQLAAFGGPALRAVNSTPERRIFPGRIDFARRMFQGTHSRPSGNGYKAHIGEVQSSLWDEANLQVCQNAGIILL